MNNNVKIVKNSLIEPPTGLKVYTLSEPLSAGLVYPVSSSRPQQEENKHQPVSVDDGCGNAFVDGARHGLPGQAVPVPVELQLVGDLGYNM